MVSEHTYALKNDICIFSLTEKTGEAQMTTRIMSPRDITSIRGREME